MHRGITFEQVFAVMHAGVMVVDADGIIRFFNPAAEQIDGLKAADIIGRPVAKVFPNTGLLEVLQSGQPQLNQPYRMPGGYCLVNRTPIWQDGKVVGVVGVFQDGAELEAALARVGRVQAMYEELEAVFQSLEDEVVVADGQGRVIRANPACARFYGCPADQLIGRNTAELERNGYFVPAVTPQVLKKGERLTVLQTTCTGRKLLVTGHPVFDEQGEISLVVCTARDVTELQQLQEQLEAVTGEVTRYRQELEEVRRQQGMPEEHARLVATSPSAQVVMQMAEQVAPFDSTVLILGETGVGKNQLARQIHERSRRAAGPFVEINCGAIPETLLESELFGYQGGAFTGARKEGKVGLIEAAHGGTLFLNEIGEMPLHLQVKLLQVLQDRTMVRVGGTAPIRVDVRVIAATNRDLEQMVHEGKFRADLYFRLNVVPIRIPPLRERPEDLVAIATRHLAQLNRQYGLRRQFSPAVLESLLRHSWPGNIRELENTVERLFVIARGEEIKMGDLPDNLKLPPDGGSREMKAEPKQLFDAKIEAVEYEMLRRAYEQYGSSYKVAAALGLSQSTAVRKLRKYGISHKWRG